MVDHSRHRHGSRFSGSTRTFLNLLSLRHHSRFGGNQTKISMASELDAHSGLILDNSNTGNSDFDGAVIRNCGLNFLHFPAILFLLVEEFYKSCGVT